MAEIFELSGVSCRVWIMSVIATLMSFCYSFIGLGLSIAKATGAHTCVQPYHHDSMCIPLIKCFLSACAREPLGQAAFMVARLQLMLAAVHENGTGSADGLWEDQTPASKTWGIFQVRFPAERKSLCDCSRLIKQNPMPFCLVIAFGISWLTSYVSMQALGSVAFAYSFSFILIEITVRL